MKIHRVIRFKGEPLNKGDPKEREEAIRVNHDASENIQQEECRPSPKLKLPKEFNDANMQLRTCIRLAFEERNKENLFGVFGPDAERMINELKRFEIMNLEILRKLSSLQSSDLIILVWSNETRDGIEDFFYDGNFIFANLT